ncbi:MAG: DUF6982 domain-containing protein [Syntrophales bacterium]|jgi:hypothetical protein
MIQNKIVVRYQDGRISKGVTSDFFPDKDVFHLLPVNTLPDAKPITVSVQELKAVFFVKTFEGNREYKDKKDLEADKAVAGRKIRVIFKDGEVLVGTTHGYQPGRPGFFIHIVDPQSNNERCFVISVATQEVSFI